MPKPYQHKPCRACGGPKEPNSRGRVAGWYCVQCRAQIWKKYDRNFCGSKAKEHSFLNCIDCRRIKRDKQRDAAMRGVETRRRTQAGWFRPFNAEKFWQGRAHSAVQAAIKKGVLPSLKAGEYACTDCGGVALEYDHRDYSRPLDVQPVCRSCNKQRGTATWPSPDRYAFTRISAKPSKSEAA